MSVSAEVLKLVSESGNNFHAKVAQWMQANGWHVTVSPYYMDQTQNKAREIDLVAEKLWPVWEHREIVGDVAVRLFMEATHPEWVTIQAIREKDFPEALIFVPSSGLVSASSAPKSACKSRAATALGLLGSETWPRGSGQPASRTSLSRRQ